MRLAPLAVIVALAHPAPAFACECLFEPSWHRPRGHPMQPASVPTNAVLYASASWTFTDEAAALFDPDGARVAGAWSTIRRALYGVELNVFTPAAPLVAGATYQLLQGGPNFAERYAADGDGMTRDVFLRERGEHVTTVLVADAVDEDAPALPDVRFDRSWSTTDPEWAGTGGNHCDMGDTAWSQAWFDVAAAPDAVVLLADLNDEAELAFDPPQGLASYAEPFAGTVDVGTTICSVRWPAARAGDTGHVRFGVLDIAGRFSGWSSPVSFTYADGDVDAGVAPMDEPAPGGCAQGTGGAGPVALAALLVAALRRRRARSIRLLLPWH